MKAFVSALLLLALSATAQALPAHYFGEISGSGDYAGTVTSNSAWVNPPVFGLNSFGEQQVNLWGFNAVAGQTLSLEVSSTDDFIGGISVYKGEVSSNDLLFGNFNNSADTGSASFVAGTSTWGLDSLLTDLLLELDGFYTIIVGGKNFFETAASYSYVMNVTASPVSEPGTLAILALGFAGLVAARRRNSIAA